MLYRPCEAGHGFPGYPDRIQSGTGVQNVRHAADYRKENGAAKVVSENVRSIYRAASSGNKD